MALGSNQVGTRTQGGRGWWTGRWRSEESHKEGSSNTSDLLKFLHSKLPHSALAVKQVYREKLKQWAQPIWSTSYRHEQIKNTDLTTPSGKYVELPRKLVSILTQLRTGHAPLAKHLHYIGKIDSPECPTCQQSNKTVQHFLLHCPVHRDARQALCRATGGRDINLTKLFTTSKTLRALFIYVANTGCLHDTFRELPTLEKEPLERRERQAGENVTM